MAFGNGRRNQLGRTQPLIASRPIDTKKKFGDVLQERNVFSREPTNVQSLMSKDRFCHHGPFEYEYRCTKYGYDYPDE